MSPEDFPKVMQSFFAEGGFPINPDQAADRLIRLSGSLENAGQCFRWNYSAAFPISKDEQELKEALERRGVKVPPR